MRLYLPGEVGIFKEPLQANWALLQEKGVHARKKDAKFEEFKLLARCRRGDLTAMEELIVKYQNRIYNTILRISGNPDDAAELTQDAFVKVLENIDRFQERSSFYTWLFRIAVNLTLNYRSRTARMPTASLDAERYTQNGAAAGNLRAFLTDDGSPGPAELAEKKEVYGLVYKALARMDETHRTVIVLRDIEQMSYAEISEILNIELGTVKSRLSRARASLREILLGTAKSR